MTVNPLTEWLHKHPIVPFIREGDFAVRKPWIHPQRRLLDYLLIYIQKGHCRFTVDHVPYDFQSGEFCLIQPGSLNTLEGLTDTVTPFAHFDIFYHSERDKSFPTKPGQINLSQFHHLMQPRLDVVCAAPIPVRLQPQDPERFGHSMLQMVECWQHGDPLMQLRAQTHAINLIVMALEAHLPLGTKVRTTSNSLHWITSYLSIHMSENLSVSDMARRANLSPSRFSTRFKREFGVSPHQFLLDLRIRHAKDLLRTTSLSIDSIGMFCGFSDIYHFSKAFKNKECVSPTSYRRGIQSEGIT